MFGLRKMNGMANTPQAWACGSGRQTESTIEEDNKKQNEQIHTSKRLIIIVNGKEKIVTSYYTNGKLTGSSQYDTETKKYDD